MTELERIKRAIKKSGFTQNEFAEKLNYKTRTFANYLSGHTKLDIDGLKKIAKLLNLPVGYFFDENYGNGIHINGNGITNGSNNKINVQSDKKEIEHLKQQLDLTREYLDEMRQRLVDKDELIEMYKNK